MEPRGPTLCDGGSSTFGLAEHCRQCGENTFKLLVSFLPPKTRRDLDATDTFRIAVAGAPRAVTTDGALPVEWGVRGPDGKGSGLILVWVEGGAPVGLEYAWYTDDPPTQWPSRERVTVRFSAR